MKRFCEIGHTVSSDDQWKILLNEIRLNFTRSIGWHYVKHVQWHKVMFTDS